jgi:hypothetical protein
MSRKSPVLIVIPPSVSSVVRRGTATAPHVKTHSIRRLVISLAPQLNGAKSVKPKYLGLKGATIWIVPSASFPSATFVMGRLELAFVMWSQFKRRGYDGWESGL